MTSHAVLRRRPHRDCSAVSMTPGSQPTARRAGTPAADRRPRRLGPRPVAGRAAHRRRGLGARRPQPELPAVLQRPEGGAGLRVRRSADRRRPGHRQLLLRRRSGRALSVAHWSPCRLCRRPRCPPVAGALGCTGLGTVCTVASGVSGAASSAAGSVVGFGVGSVLDAVSSWVTGGAVWLLGQIGGVLSTTTAIDLGAPWFRSHYATMVGAGRRGDRAPPPARRPPGPLPPERGHCSCARCWSTSRWPSC